MEVLYRNANLLLPRRFLQSDDSALPLASIAALSVELIQGTTSIATYVYGTDNQLRADPDATNGALLELTPALSATLSAGRLTEKWTVTVADTDYSQSSNVRKVTFEMVDVDVR